MPVQVNLSLRHAFVLTPDIVRRLWEVLESNIGRTVALARCADHARREFDDVSKLLDYDNAKGKRTQSLTL